MSDGYTYELDQTYPRTPGITPSQTVGPYLHIGLPWKDGPDVVPPGTEDLITIVGAVYDGNGDVILDAMIETWQADPDGRFNHPDDPRGAVEPAMRGFRGFGRSETDTGEYQIRTVKPGSVATADGERQAPHIDVSVFARGMINRCVTRIYFPDEAEANSADPLLSEVPEDRRHTLIAVDEGHQLRFDIHLQGDEETVFFDL